MRRPEILAGVSVAAFARGNRRIIAAAKGRSAAPPDPCTHPEHQKPTHAEHCASHPTPVAPADEPHPFKVWALRIVGTAAALYVLWPLVGRWAPTTLAVTATAWTLAALILGQETGSPEDSKKPAPDAGHDAQAERTGPTAPAPADARHAVALLGASGGHVALTAAAAQLAAAHPLWKRSGKATKVLLQEAGIRVRDGVKVAGVSVPGIHQDDVPPLPSPSASTPGGVVVPGQSNNNNHNNAQGAAPRQGFTSQPDPDNPARTIITHAA